ncbi:unnamed protein product [Heterobilharzia americana]|nr:unnamed protein product [Heterobilharzia americana]
MVIMDEEDAAFIRTLAVAPAHRSPQENAAIFGYLRTIEGLNISGPSSAYRDAELRTISHFARYRRVPGDVLLYHTGEWCDSWFILISGSVLIESSMFLPRACFGTRTNGNFYRRNDCLVLEPSDLVVIDYLDSESLPVSFTDTHRQAVAPYKHRPSLDLISNSNGSSSRVIGVSSSDRCLELPHNVGSPLKTPPSSSVVPLNHEQDKRIRRAVKAKPKLDSNDPLKSSHLSDTSSAHSLSSGGIQNDTNHGRSFQSPNTTTPEKHDKKQINNCPGWYKTGSDTSHLADSEEDDDEEEDEDEEDFESGSHESIRDAFWESILKLPSERTQEDIDLLLENVGQLPAFSNLTKATCRSLCFVMVLAIVREAGQIVLNDNEKLDTWSVVLNGTVEVIEPDGTIRELTRGDAFGVRPGKTDRIHHGVMRTVTEDCHFLCVPQTDYIQIMSREGEAEIPEMGEGGRVVLVYESLQLDTNLSMNLNKSSCENSIMSRKCRLVTKGTPEKLIEHLIADLSNMDITYPEDFLLTYRTFLDSPRPIVDRLLSWHLHSPKLRSRVNRIILLWVHNHFNDFEDSHEMMKSIEKFDNMLSSDGTAGERRLFRLACSTKARPRHVEIIIPLKVSRNFNAENKPSRGEQHSSSNHNISSLIDLPFTMIGGEDGFGVFIHQVYGLVPNSSSEAPFDVDTNQKYTNSTSLSSSASSCDSGYPCSYILPNFSSAHNQIRRADQLLAVNGRSVEHLKPSDVIQLIHSVINACCSLDSISTSNTSNTINDSSIGSSPSSSSHTSTNVMNTTMTTVDNSKASSCSSVGATFNLRLLVIFNPVQYYQVVNSLNTISTTNTLENFQTMDDFKTQIRKCSPLPNVTNSPINHNGDGICKPKKHSLPMSISIPNDLVISADNLQSSPTVLLPTKTIAPGSSFPISTFTTSLQNNSLGRRGQNCHSLSYTAVKRSSHSANTSPTRLSNHHEDNQEYFKKTTDNNKQSITSQSQFHNNNLSRPYEQHSSTEKLNNSRNTDNINYSNSMQRSSSQPDLVMMNDITSSKYHPAFNEYFVHHHHHLINGFDYLSTNGGGNNANGDNLSVIRVWRSSDNGKDHSSKLIILPRRQTNACEATRLCIEEFGIPEEDQNSYCLYHVTVESGPIVKQSRLANIVDDLAGRLTLNSRYYLKNLRNHDPLIADDIAKSILAESRVTFTQLPPEELAARLTLDDYEVFRTVQSTEYIDEVFGLSNTCVDNVSTTTSNSGAPVGSGNGNNSGYATGHENLDRFTDLVNREAYWAPTEICNESNLNRRVDLLKRFIKLAKLCRELRNFNTMFCLLVGLHQTCVERLKQTWERLPNKYQKIYRDLSMVLDTSRNFHHYRSLISTDNASAPMLPYLPLVLKDLTFIHLGNPSRTPDGLINFVKLRMLAKEVRAICRMCNVDYDLCTTTQRNRVTGGRTRAGVNLSAVKAVAAVSSINPKSYFSNITSSVNNNTNNGADSSWSDYDIVEVKLNNFNTVDESKQQHQNREKKPNLDINPTTNASNTNVNASGANAGYKRNHQQGSSVTSVSSGNLNLGLPISTPIISTGGGGGGGGGGGIRRRSNLGIISSSINPKKIYESWLMTLRIRTYLANLKVVQDPELLSQMSTRLEPGAKDSKIMQPLTTSTAGGGTSATSGGNESQQLDVCSLSSDNTTELKDSKLSTKNSAQPVTVDTNSNKKCSPKVVFASTGPVSSSSPTTTITTSCSASTVSGGTFTRPILGAQSIEDARKLLALSENSRRSSQRRLPAFTFPNHHHNHNSNNTNANQPIFITPPLGSYAGIGFGQLKSHNNHNASSHHMHNNLIQVSTNPQISSTSGNPNVVISTCSNHLHHHHYSHAHPRYPQGARCYSTSAGTMGSKSLLLDNLIPMPSRITGTGGNPNMNNNSSSNNGNANSASNQIYALLPNQRHPSHLQQQLQQPHYHPLTYHQASASPPHNRSQPTTKHQYVVQTTNQNTNYHYQQQQQNLQSRSNHFGPRPTPKSNSVCTGSHQSCQGISSQQQMSCTYWHPNSTGGSYTAQQNQQVTVSSARSREQPSLQQQKQQQQQNLASFTSDENYLYPTANTHPIGGPVLSIPRHYRQSTIQRINPQYLNAKPTRPPPYEVALALRHPQNDNVQRVQQSPKHDTSITRHENNYRIANNLSPGSKQRPSGHISMIQAQNLKLETPSFNTKQPSDIYSQQPANYSLSVSTSSRPEPTNTNNLQSRPPERNKSSTVCQSPQQRTQQRPSPPSYQQVLSMTRQGNNQGSLKIISAQSHPHSDHYQPNGRPQPPQRTMATLSSNCNHANFRASSASPGITIVRPIVNDLNSVEPRQRHVVRSTQKTTFQ